MSPATRRRPSGRAETAVRAAGRDLGSAVRSAPGAAARAVTNRTTRIQCPWCPTRPWIPSGQWENHSAAHRTADTRRTLHGQRIAHQRRAAETEERAERVERERLSRPRSRTAPPSVTVHTRPRDAAPSSRVRYVDDAGNPIDWRPGDPLPGAPEPDPELSRPGDPPRTGIAAATGALIVAVVTGVTDWLRSLFAPPSPPAPAEDPTPQPQETRPMPPRTRTAPKKTNRTASAPTGSASTSAATAAGAAGAEGIVDGANRWAAAVPETLVSARHDTQAITEAITGLADAMTRRMNAETDRGISPHCVEPLGEAAQLLRGVAEKVQEVHERLLTRYRATAEDLARPDTPDPAYLREGV